jgi:hypothetical protein
MTTVRRVPTHTFRHFDHNGFELCSGREGWATRKTRNPAEVTCKNCLKAMDRSRKQKTAIGARGLAEVLFSNTDDPGCEPTADSKEVCILVQAFDMTFDAALGLYVEVRNEILNSIDTGE